MHPHCELAIRDILPAVRSLMSQYYIDKGLNQGQIAQKLMLTQPAVSKYLRESRGKQAQIFKENTELYQEIKDAAEHVLHGNKNPDLFCKICSMVRKKRLICNCCAYQPHCHKDKEEKGYG